MGTSLLKPGGFYSVRGKERGSGPGFPESIRPTMYVRDERVGGVNWNVFAAIWQNGCLMRVKVPTDGAIIRNSQVELPVGHHFLETTVICLPRSERAKSVETFIQDAYRLIRKGPNASSFETDAYELAGVFGLPDERARLKLIIDHYKRRAD